MSSNNRLARQYEEMTNRNPANSYDSFRYHEDFRAGGTEFAATMGTGSDGEIFESDRKGVELLLKYVWRHGDLEDDAGKTWEEFSRSSKCTALKQYCLMASTSIMGQEGILDTLFRKFRIHDTFMFARSTGGYTVVCGGIITDPTCADDAESALSKVHDSLRELYNEAMDLAQEEGRSTEDDSLAINILLNNLPFGPDDSEVMYAAKKAALGEALASIAYDRNGPSASPLSYCQSILDLSTDSFLFSSDPGAINGTRIYGITPEDADLARRSQPTNPNNPTHPTKVRVYSN